MKPDTTTIANLYTVLCEKEKYFLPLEVHYFLPALDPSDETKLTTRAALLDEFYKENKLPAVSIIINDVKMKPGYGYYGYGRYGYGYGYGYGSYYEEEHPPKNIAEKLIEKADPRNWFGKK